MPAGGTGSSHRNQTRINAHEMTLFIAKSGNCYEPHRLKPDLGCTFFLSFFYPRSSLFIPGSKKPMMMPNCWGVSDSLCLGRFHQCAPGGSRLRVIEMLRIHNGEVV